MSLRSAKRQKGPPLIDKRDPAFLVRPFQQIERKPDAWFRSEAHLRFVRSLACRACGRTQHVAAAHLWKSTDGAKSEKPSDFYTNPLCDGSLDRFSFTGCHQIQHRGEVTFWARFGGVDIAREEALLIASHSPCSRTRKAAQAVLEGKDWREAV